MKRLTICAGIAACATAATANDVFKAGDLRAAMDITKIEFVGKEALEANPHIDRIPGSLIVTFSPEATDEERDLSRIIADTQQMRSFAIADRVEHLMVKDSVAAKATLEMLPWVEAVEDDMVLRSTQAVNDTFFEFQWGLHNEGQSIGGFPGTSFMDIGAINAWETTTGDPDLVIAVIDTGVQWDHPDIDGNIWINPGEIAGNGIDDDGNGYIDDIRGWDFYDNDNNPTDPGGHGTHVAGTIASEGNNNTGVTGVLWQCKIMPVRFLGPNGGTTADAIAAVDYVVATGCKLSNNSWGGAGYSAGLRAAIENAGAAGHLFVTSAGNSAWNNDFFPAYPANYTLDNIISVASLRNTGELSGFSNFGRSSVDVGAPGSYVASLYNQNRYVYLSGTSMASPHVAGVAGLVWSAFPSLTHEEVRDAIFESVVPLNSLNGFTTTGGMVNAEFALVLAGGGTVDDLPPPPPSENGPPTAPVGVLASPGSGQATVNWIDNSNNEDGFEIQWDIRYWQWWFTGGSATEAPDTTSTTITGLESGLHRFRVRSYNSEGPSVWSAWQTITVN